jgi:hypothetical protein
VGEIDPRKKYKFVQFKIDEVLQNIQMGKDGPKLFSKQSKFVIAKSANSKLLII